MLPRQIESSIVAMLVLLACLAVLPCAINAAEPFKMTDGYGDAGIGQAVDDWCKDANSTTAKYGGINTWDVSGVKVMAGLFEGKGEFNDDISSWKTAGVVDMTTMFSGAEGFNQNIDSWQMDSVASTAEMFQSAESFNQNINSWQTGSVVAAQHMFSGCDYLGKHKGKNPTYWNMAFNQPLNSWQMGNATDISYMFKGANSFDQNINSWQTSSVTTLFRTFSDAVKFNHPLDSWKTGSVSKIDDVFVRTARFNQPLDSWQTGSVTMMNSAFYSAKAFNQDVDSWQTGSMTSMEEVFTFAASFNQPLNSWQTGSVNSMRSTFLSATSFDQDLSAWQLDGMVPGAESANGDVDSNVQWEGVFFGTFKDTNLNICNKAALRAAWAQSQDNAAFEDALRGEDWTWAAPCCKVWEQNDAKSNPPGRCEPALWIDYAPCFQPAALGGAPQTSILSSKTTGRAQQRNFAALQFNGTLPQRLRFPHRQGSSCTRMAGFGHAVTQILKASFQGTRPRHALTGGRAQERREG